MLATPVSHVTGIDLAEELVFRARRVFAEDVSRGRLRVEHGSVEAMPFPDESFDGVYSVNCIYFWPDPRRGLEEVSRVLRPTGSVVLGVDARWKKLFQDPYRGFDGPDAEQALRRAGFVDVRCGGFGRYKAVVTVREQLSGAPVPGVVPNAAELAPILVPSRHGSRTVDPAAAAPVGEVRVNLGKALR